MLLEGIANVQICNGVTLQNREVIRSKKMSKMAALNDPSVVFHFLQERHYFVGLKNYLDQNQKITI